MKFELLDQYFVDTFKISELFSVVYPEKSIDFNEDYFEWRYKNCFSGITRIVSVFDDGKLIGQAAIFEQKAKLGERYLRIGQLGDLATHPRHRSIQLVREIYKGLSKVLAEDGIDLFITIPNKKSVSLNKRFLKLNTLAEVSFHAGLAPIHRFWTRNISTTPVKNLSNLSLEQIAKRTSSAPQNLKADFHFSREISDLRKRCSSPTNSDAAHIYNGAILITRAKRFFGIPYFVLLASNENPNNEPSQLSKILAHAARYHRTPIFIVWGIGARTKRILNSAILSRELSKKMTVQVHDKENILRSPSTIELIDLDVDF